MKRVRHVGAWLIVGIFVVACGGEASTPAGCNDDDGDGYWVGSDCVGEQAAKVDCDDANSAIHTGATEICGNGVDEDCSGADLSCDAPCQDGDGDGYGVGATCAGADCDDTDAAVHPGATEVCGNGKDDDCTGGDLACPVCLDEDQDGYGTGPDCTGQTDCNDADAAIHPGATEVCGNGKDEDCVGGDLVCPSNCVDQDGDGYGVGTDCAGIDCNDGDKNVHPGATEICGNGKDDDCMLGDEACPKQCLDKDYDGYGEGPDCDGPDCNDVDPAIHPYADEICGDSIDQDCQGGDLACPDECVDQDSDGYGVGATCPAVDCDDADKDVHPGATEVCGDGIDQDCANGDLPCTVVCEDNDGDGYGKGTDCQGVDCNDDDPAINPGKTEICGNGKDDDCDGTDEACPTDCVDADQDGYGVGADCTDPKDCDDTDPAVSPALDEVCGNGKDDDCDGTDEACPQTACTTDANCPAEQLCDLKTGECRYAKVWEWWAPTVYQDTDNAHPWEDILTDIDFDGDGVVLNNVDGKSSTNKPAKIYYSFVKTSTHWYLGYYVYYPWRWSSFGVLGTQYANAMRGVLVVVEQDGSTYGKLVLMETTTEDPFFQYIPPTGTLSGSASIDGDVRFDATGHHPIVYAHAGDHNLYGDSYWGNNVSNWEIDGFPGDDGVIYRWGNKVEAPASNDDEVSYELFALKDFLWPARFETAGGTQPFDEFGHFTANEYDAHSLAPWRFADGNAASRPHGEFLYDPTDFVKAHFAYGWGLFSHAYVYNPYALRLDLDDLQVVDYEADPLGGYADPFVTLYTNDGSGRTIKVLDLYYGLQNNWGMTDVDPALYPLDMHFELGRYSFFGIEHPDFHFFGIDVKDDDGGWTAADWLMDEEQTYWFSDEGEQFLDFGESNCYVTVTAP